MEQEQGGIWTTTGRSKNKEGISPPTGCRKNDDIDIFRVEQPKGRKIATGSLATKISILDYIKFNNK